MSDLTISTETMKRVDLITAAGRIDSSNAQELDDALKTPMENGRHNLVIDMQDVTYMSSAGLRALVAALRECKKHSGDVRLCNPSERVMDVLHLAGLDSLFAVYEDATAAVGSF
ncbi:MAG: STAS domain-containing protein [Anaerolineales bacterium]|nr:STAS domain-containing protein [Anaerolineales bacterium]